MDAARKVKLGQRWVCYACGGRFYDLNRSEPVCPRCKADQCESPVRAKPKGTRGKKAAPKPPDPAPEAIEEPLVVSEDVDALDEEPDHDLDQDDPSLEDASEPDDGPNAG